MTSTEDSLQPGQVNAGPALEADANDLDADASYYYGYSRPWRYGWKSGWNGWGGLRSGWGWAGRGWTGRSGWW